MKQLKVFKLGGKLIDDNLALDDFLQKFSKVEGPKILVHGGGNIASEFGEKLGIIPNLHEGRRITNDETIDLVTMIYAGLVNKKMVAKLQEKEVDAIGLSGADGNCVLSEKRSVKEIDYGWVGDVKLVDDIFLMQLIELGKTPVLCALTHDGNGNILNTNADTMASEIASAVSQHFKVMLDYKFEKSGVLLDVEDENSLVSEIDKEYYQELKIDGKIHSGMIPKLDNCFEAIAKGVTEVRIGETRVV